MEDDNGEKLCTNFTYENINKITKEKKICTLFIILNLVMAKNLFNNNISQYFGDCTYHCIPPTFRKYKLFVKNMKMIIKYNFHIFMNL